MMLDKLRQRDFPALTRAVGRRLLPRGLKWLASERRLLPPILRKLTTQNSFTIVQVGAFKGGGSETDQLAEFIKDVFPAYPGARALLIEPVNDYFKELVNYYAGLPNIAFENVAVAESAGPREFYRLGPVDPYLTDFPNGCPS